jgi:hypothetical protein
MVILMQGGIAGWRSIIRRGSFGSPDATAVEGTRDASSRTQRALGATRAFGFICAAGITGDKGSNMVPLMQK